MFFFVKKENALEQKNVTKKKHLLLLFSLHLLLLFIKMYLFWYITFIYMKRLHYVNA